MNVATIAIVGAVSISVVVSTAARKRTLTVEITLPTKAVARPTVPEGEGFVVTLPDGTRFGFVPTISPDGEAVVTVDIWDLNRKPMHKLGSVTIEAGGSMVRSDTSPSFGVRVLRVIQPK